MSFKRADRVSVLIQKALFEIFSRGLNDPRICNISITSVNVTDDLRLARINYVALGGKGNVEELKAGMESAKGFISREMAKKVKLKYTPKLEFFYDEMLLETYEIIDKIDESIEQRQLHESLHDHDSEEDTSEE
jgi:ribosome-binding factor A